MRGGEEAFAALTKSRLQCLFAHLQRRVKDRSRRPIRVRPSLVDRRAQGIGNAVVARPKRRNVDILIHVKARDGDGCSLRPCEN
jgi:hypothetical protein